jgi:ATP-dependent Clp protease adaptor protein ClpS
MRTWEQEDSEVAVLDAPLHDIDKQIERQLVVFNDEHNTFDHVIETLIDVCGHTAEQAEQCTLIIHYKGKCIVKLGTLGKLKQMCAAICERGIAAKVL